MLPPNISAARRFIDLATMGARPSNEALVRCLDELALSYHDTPIGEPNESDDRPPPETRVKYADIGARFPDLGYYGTADPQEVSGETVVGDAIDDILDITNDLKEVVWRFERFGGQDAHWYFRFLFQIHWGKHLRDLARYLHSRLRFEEEQHFD
jgi:hypothetical protein